MRVALYGRVSTLSGQNPEMQLTELREYACRRGWGAGFLSLPLPSKLARIFRPLPRWPDPAAPPIVYVYSQYYTS
jgi:hypothetical protein